MTNLVSLFRKGNVVHSRTWRPKVYMHVKVVLKRTHYELCVTQSGSRLTKSLVNNIHIYGFKLIYYENTFHN